jgi:hypothetical protein
MRHFNIMAAVAATLLVGGIASAKEKPEAAKEKKICVLSEDSASRLGVKRICRTKAEWDNGTSQSRRQAEPATEEAAGRN